LFTQEVSHFRFPEQIATSSGADPHPSDGVPSDIWSVPPRCSRPMMA